MKKTLALGAGCLAVSCSGSSAAPILGAGDGSSDAANAADRLSQMTPDSGNRDAQSGTSADARNDSAAGGSDSAVDGQPFNLSGDGGPNCGNGMLDPGEQCDDGNHFNLDGCDSACRLEVVTRMISLSIESTAAPSFCTPTTNRFGTQSLTATGLSQLNPGLQNGVNAGTNNTFLQIFGLSDLTGASDSSGLSLGVLSGAPDMAKGMWPGNNPIDWWFIADHATVDASGNPASVLTAGTITGGMLTAGPSDVNLPLPLGGTAALLRVREAYVSATINSVPAPNVPAPPPTLLAPGVTVFQTIKADGANQGLCGNMTVESLAQTPIPQVLTMGNTACSATCSGSHSYTYCGANNPVGPGCNSWLDALVGGCSVTTVCAPVVNAQQPDVAATGTVQQLTLGAGNKVPSSQTTGNGDAYSAYMKFTVNRAHFTGENCAQTSDCQTGKTCVAGACQ